MGCARGVGEQAMTDSRLRKRPTQDDVARIAGVSQTVVSMVLNDRSLVTISPETRQRVLTAIDELGYVPDGSARSLRTRKTLIIASLIPDITNPFYPAFERGIQDVADANDYDLIAYNTDGSREKELRCLRSMQRARVDGVIATPVPTRRPDDFSPAPRQSASRSSSSASCWSTRPARLSTTSSSTTTPRPASWSPICSTAATAARR